MNETAKHDDIEDVLSSIRRLVSDSASADRTSPEPAVERLVLTPALRVADAEGSFAHAVPNTVEIEPDEPSDEDTAEHVADEGADTSMHEGVTYTVADDETSPERPVDDLVQSEDEAGKAEDTPFGLSSFTGSFDRPEDAADSPDVVMFRPIQEHDEASGESEHPEDDLAEADADAGEADEVSDDLPSADSGDDTFDATADGEDLHGQEPGQEQENDDAVDPDWQETQPDHADGSEPGWPEADAEADAPDLEEPEHWPEHDEGGDETAAETAEGEDTVWDRETQSADADEAEAESDDQPDTEEHSEPHEEQEWSDAQSPDAEADDPGVVPEAAHDGEHGEYGAAPDAQDDLSGASETEDVQQASDADGDAESSQLEDDHSPAFKTLPRFEFPAENHFESEHGDVDWSETESVQPALDIAAVRQARGEEISPEPDAEPTPMPVFARSRRRPLTSLDDLLPPEAEPDTVADAVSQALADNALDRMEAGAPDETEEEAEAAGGSSIADDTFDVDADPGDDLSLIDEEALRDLIAQVVREELQGVLGQRITRNVRKMVRREIRLALAAENFE